MAKTPLRDKDMRRLRALSMLQKRLAGMSRSQIAAEFSVTPTTVDNEMDWARKQGLLVSYENQILEQLVPTAIRTVAAAVAKGDVKAALEVLKGTGLLTQKPTPIQPPSPTGEADTLEGYFKISKPVGGNLGPVSTAALSAERPALQAADSERLDETSAPSSLPSRSDGEDATPNPPSFAEGVFADGEQAGVPAGE
jgi:hypothetical protein